MSKIQHIIGMTFFVGFIEFIIGFIGALKVVGWNLDLVKFLLIKGTILMCGTVILTVIFPLKDDE